ncbi:MAG: preprotein translocase subunit YajC [Alphaproteobacteria bacterium]
MLISPAYAQAAVASPGGGIEMFLPFVLIIVIFYFLLWRPQQKKMKRHKEMLGALKRGDRVVTGGGIIGRIARVESDDELIVEIAPEVRVRVARGTVSDLVVKGQPAKNDNQPDKGDDAKKKKG